MTEEWFLALGAVLMDETPALALSPLEAFEQWALFQLGPDHWALAQAVARQAWCHARLGHRATSCSLYERALEILRQAGRDETAAFQDISDHLAARCGPADRLAGEELVAGEAGPHALVGLPRFNPLGEHSDSQERLEVLEKLIRDAAERMEIIDPFNLRVEDADAHGFMLGKLFREIGEFELAIDAFAEFARWGMQKFGEVHDTAVQTLHQLAACHTELGDFSRACEINQQVVDLLRRLEPENSAMAALESELEADCPPIPENLLFGLAHQWGEADRLEEATVALETYERWVTAEDGTGGRRLVEAMAVRGYCYERLGRDDDACRVYTGALSLASGLEWRAGSLPQVEAFVAENCSRLKDAQRAPSVPLGERWGPPLLRDMEPYLESVGDTLVELEHHDEAASAYQAAQAWHERTNEDDVPHISSLLIKRASCHVMTGEKGIACRLYERAVRMIEASEDADEEFLRSAREYLDEECS